MFRKAIAVSYILFFVVSTSLYAQTETSDSVTYYFHENRLLMASDEGDTVLLQSFTAPRWFLFDLNADQNDELMVIDSVAGKTSPLYCAYVYATDSTFRLLDSLDSGVFAPVLEFNEELGATLLQIGVPAIDSLIHAVPQDSVFAPLQYYQYTGAVLKNVTDDLYSTYLIENNAITAYLDANKVAGSICGDAARYRTAVFTGFHNYRKAGEFSLANKFMQQYYPCPDAAAIKKILEKNN